MNDRIKKINQYILERYPTIWNTKIVWVLLTALLVHALFFVIGYFSHSDPKSLHYSNAVDDFFRGGMIYISIIITLLILVVWLVNMFKNNAFKNFYPISKAQMFGQFVQYFVIILVSTSFYWSYMLGFRTFINSKYPDDEMAKNVELINKSAAFLSQEYINYDLSEKRYPKVFSDLYCETRPEHVIRTEKYFVNHARVYQFFELYSKVATEKNSHGQWLVPQPERNEKKPVAYSIRKGNSYVFYFKKRVVDVSPYLKTEKLAYTNYSTLFYSGGRVPYGPSTSNYDIDESYPDALVNDEGSDSEIGKARFALNKSVTELLERKNPNEIEALFTQFLTLSKVYQIKTNLTAKDWTSMVYHPDTFEVKKFIKQSEREIYPSASAYEDYTTTTAVDAAASAAVVANGAVVENENSIRSFNPNFDNELSPQKYYERNLTKYYYESQHLKDLLENVEVIKLNPFFKETVHIFLWLSFVLSMLIFSFRVTSLPALLFSFVTVGVLILIVTLVGVILGSISRSSGVGYIVTVFILLLTSGILLLSIFGHKIITKFINSIAVVISMNFMLVIPFSILGLITMVQTDICKANLKPNESISKCKGILEYYTAETYSLLFLIAGFVGLYLYTAVIRKWRALPE